MGKSKRVTIMIAEDLDKKLRAKQASLIKKDSKSVSYSRVINDVLRNTYKL
jgi:hypothetical protein